MKGVWVGGGMGFNLFPTGVKQCSRTRQCITT